jgi:hypothetical protein
MASAPAGLENIAEAAGKREVFVFAQNLANAQFLQIILGRIGGFQRIPLSLLCFVADGLQFAFQARVQIFEASLRFVFVNFGHDVIGHNR